MKKTLIIVGIVIAVLILIVVVLPFVVNVNRFKPTLESDLTGALGRKVEIGNIHLAILFGGVSVSNISIADDPAFSQSPFLTAKQLTAGVEIFPLIFSKRLEVRSFTISDPQVSLLRSSSGVWNFSSLGAAKPQSAVTTTQSKPPAAAGGSSGGTAASTADVSVGELKISDGTMVIGTVGAHGNTQIYREVNFEASDLSRTSQFPFKLTAKTPGNGTIDLNGKAGPLNSADASLTPFTATLDAKHFDLASTGFAGPSSGVAGTVSFTGNFSSKDGLMSSQGTAKTERIRLVANGSPSTVPIDLDYTMTYDMKRGAGTLTQGDVHIGKALAHLIGTFDTSGSSTSVAMKLNGQAMPVTDLEGVLPAAGIALPPGASLRSGTLNLNLSLNGPVDKMVIAGPVNLSNATLAGFDLKSKLGALASFAGLGGSGGSSNTQIQTLSADMHVDPSGTRANNLNLVAPSIGVITGNGVVSSTGQLDCKMYAKLGSAGGAARTVTSVLGSSGSKSQSGIPFEIQGTTSKPVFVPEVGAMAEGMLKSAAGAGAGKNPAAAAQGVLGGLFGKKKKR